MVKKHQTCSKRVTHMGGLWGQKVPCKHKAIIERDGKWYCEQHDPGPVEGGVMATGRMVENPFDIDKPEYALHDIDKIRTKLLSKELITMEEQETLYRLRIAELLTILDVSNAEYAALEKDYLKLKGT